MQPPVTKTQDWAFFRIEPNKFPKTRLWIPMHTKRCGVSMQTRFWIQTRPRLPIWYEQICRKRDGQQRLPTTFLLPLSTYADACACWNWPCIWGCIDCGIDCGIGCPLNWFMPGYPAFAVGGRPRRTVSVPRKQASAEGNINSITPFRQSSYSPQDGTIAKAIQLIYRALFNTNKVY